MAEKPEAPRRVTEGDAEFQTLQTIAGGFVHGAYAQARQLHMMGVDQNHILSGLLSAAAIIAGDQIASATEDLEDEVGKAALDHLMSATKRQAEARIKATLEAQAEKAKADGKVQ